MLFSSTSDCSRSFTEMSFAKWTNGTHCPSKISGYSKKKSLRNCSTEETEETSKEWYANSLTAFRFTNFLFSSKIKQSQPNSVTGWLITETQKVNIHVVYSSKGGQFSNRISPTAENKFPSDISVKVLLHQKHLIGAITSYTYFVHSGRPNSGAVITVRVWGWSPWSGARVHDQGSGSLSPKIFLYRA